MENSSPLTHPNNSQTIFAALRDVLLLAHRAVTPTPPPMCENHDQASKWLHRSGLAEQ